MTLSRLSNATLVAPGVALFLILSVPIVAFARPASGNLEFVNRPYWNDYGLGRDRTNYDREVNGSDASTPGHN